MKRVSGRVGQNPIVIPSGVTFEQEAGTVRVTGGKGSLTLDLDRTISAEVVDNTIIIKRKNDLKRVKAMHGTVRNLIANMITGVNTGWSKNLELVGVGFRAAGGGNKIVLNIGYSHPVEVVAPDGITFEVAENTKIKVLGIDKQLVGQVSANLRQVRKPDVYKGKGVRYVGEYIRKKLGKSGKVGVTK